MSNPTTVSLAILKVNWDRLRKDYLENFLPFVSESLRLSLEPGFPISLAMLQESLRSNFGLNLPQNTLDLLLRRLRKRGVVILKNHAFYANAEQLNHQEFQQARGLVIEQHDQLMKALRAFSLEKYALELTSEQSESAIQDYLQDNEWVLARSMAESIVMPIPDGTPIRGIRYVVGAFVQELQETASPLLQYLETVVQGFMLAHAIFVPNPESIGRRFRGTELYFDTSFLIYALGYAGVPRQQPCKELLQLLENSGAQLRCFKHTSEEMRGILYSCANLIESGKLENAFGPSIEYFLTHRYSPSDILMLASNLETDLEDLRIRVVSAPSYQEHEYVIDEKALAALLDKSIGYRKNAALQRDVQSAAAIMRLRRGERPYLLEESRAVLVTPNERLARLVRDFTYREENGSGLISPFITDTTLTTLLWLKHPLEAPDLPRKRLAADSYAAIQPNPELWLAYLEEIDVLRRGGEISEDDYFVLRHDLEARNLLMEKTLGDDEAFTRGTVQEILDLTREKMTAELRAELEGEKQAHQEADLKAAEADARRRREITRVCARVVENADRTARHLIRAIEIALLGVSLALLLLTSPLVTLPANRPALRWLFFGFFLLLSVVSAGNLVLGFSARSLLAPIERKLSHWLSSRQLQALSINPEDENALETRD